MELMERLHPQARRVGAAIVALAAALLVLAGPARASSIEAVDEEARFLSGSVIDAIMSRNIDWLETTSARFRSEKTRSLVGGWMLRAFYRDVENQCVSPPPDPEINEPLLAMLPAWKERFPRSPTPYIIEATCRLALASAIRGNQTVDKVWEDAWAAMAAELARSTEVLVSSASVSAADPQWHAVKARINLLMGVDEARFMAEIERAIAAEPMYFAYYDVTALRLLPRWGGSYAKPERFARYAAEKTRHIAGDAMYAYVAFALRGLHSDREILRDFKFDWRRVKSGTLQLIGLGTVADINQMFDLAEMACVARDQRTVAAMMDKARTLDLEVPKDASATFCRDYLKSRPQGH